MTAAKHGYRAGSGLRISEPLHGGEREFWLGADVAYGWAEPDGSCGLTHAPDQGQLDRVAAALDAMEMDDVAALLSQPDTHGCGLCCICGEEPIADGIEPPGRCVRCARLSRECA